MRSSSSFLIRSFSLRRNRADPATVVPLPERSRFDRQLTAELDKLINNQSQGVHHDEYCSSVVEAIDVSIKAQKMAMDSLSRLSLISDSDRRYVDIYLENNVDMLDTCNYLTEKIEMSAAWVESLNTVMHLIDGDVELEPSEFSLKRASDKLESCQALQKQCAETEKRFSCHFKKMSTSQRPDQVETTELMEVLSCSKAMAFMVFRLINLTFSFNSKRQLPSSTRSFHHHPMFSSWSNSLQEFQTSTPCSKLTKLQQAVHASRELQEQVKGKNQKGVVLAVERLRRICVGMELDVIQERLKDLYKNLIDFRVCLLGILSQT